jgi:hypothetical protein
MQAPRHATSGNAPVSCPLHASSSQMDDFNGFVDDTLAKAPSDGGQQEALFLGGHSMGGVSSFIQLGASSSRLFRSLLTTSLLSLLSSVPPLSRPFSSSLLLVPCHCSWWRRMQLSSPESPGAAC